MDKMINKLAWSFHNTTGIEFEELRAQACLLYCEALQDFDETKGTKLSTYVYSRLTNELISFCRKEKQAGIVYVEDVTRLKASLKFSYEECPWEEVAETLPDSLKKIVDVVFEYADQLDGAPKIMRGQLREILKKEGMKTDQIWTGIREMKQWVKELC